MGKKLTNKELLGVPVIVYKTKFIAENLPVTM